MPLVSSALASGLQSMTPTPVEATAIANFTSAWETYFYGSSIQGIPAVVGTLAAASSAMQGALVGMSAPGAGATKIQAGIQAFWAALLGSAATIWLPVPNVVVPPAIQPPTLSGIAAALEAVFAGATSTQESLSQASSDIASALHSNGGLGGTVTLQPPAAAPPIVGVPIL